MSLADSFGRSDFARFINSPTGRLLRLAIGTGLVSYGATQRATQTGVVLMLLGLLPLLTGALDLCLISALLGGPFSGDRVRDTRAP